MKLKSIELMGFKSFVEKTIMNFEPGMTAIIGPNGSGKSNISDAVRWVLGEMSSKSLRGSKMEDFIFNGTQSRPAAHYTYVSITLDTTEEHNARALEIDMIKLDEENQTDDEKPVNNIIKPYKLSDGTEITITRKYYRSGESEYYVNKKQVRLRDIYDLIYDTGIGKEGYSVIGQGKIGEVLSQKGDERRSIFEEAAGISKFRNKKTESERKLRDTEANLLRINDILTEITSRVEPLRRESENAKKYLTLSEEKKGLEITLWLDRVDKVKTDKSQAENSLASSKLDFDNATADFDKNEEDLDMLINMSYEIAKSISETERQTSDKRMEKTMLDGMIETDKNSIMHYKRETENIEKQYEAVENKRHSNEIKQNSIKVELDDLKSKIDEKQTTIDETVKIYNGITENIQNTKSDLKNIQANQKELSDHKVELMSLLAGAKSNLENEQRNKDDFSNRKSVSDDRLSELKATANDSALKLTAAQAELVSIENNIKEKRQFITNSHIKINELKEEITTKRIAVTAAEQRRENLRRTEQLFEGFSDGVKVILSGVRDKRLDISLHGSVSQLLSAPEEYVTALETALAAAVQFLVVESVDDAKKAIAHLKQNHAGRATFLPLSVIKSNIADVNSIKHLKGYIGIASELCVIDKKYIEIARDLLGRTIVATDLDSASVIAKNCNYKLKIVTTDGQLIHPGGSYTGGAAGKKAGMLSRSTDIENLGVKIKKLNNELLIDESAKMRMENDIAKSEADIADLTARLNDQRIIHDETANEHTSNLVRLDEETNKINEMIRSNMSNEERVAGYIAEISRSEAKLSEYNNETVKNEAETEKLIVEIENLESAQRDVSNRLSDEKNQLSEIRNAYQYRELSYTEISAEIQNENNNIKSLNKQLSDLKNFICELENKIEENIKSVSEIEAYLSNAENEFKDLYVKRDENELKCVEKRAAAKNIQQRKDEMYKIYTGYETKNTMLGTEQDAIIGRLSDEYELTYTEAQAFRLPADKMDKAQSRLQSLKSQIKSMGTINVNAVEEYTEVKARYDFLSSQVNDLMKTRKSLDLAILKLDATMKSTFTECFNNINNAFGKVFTELFGGGSAHIELEDAENPLDCGIDIILRPPGKTVKSISLLSGGEQSFAAIALYLALQSINPSPFCIFDEIESALDDMNLARFADYVHSHADLTQYILITHRRGTMERADTLYGITMHEKGVSDFIKLNMKLLDEKFAEFKLN